MKNNVVIFAHFDLKEVQDPEAEFYKVSSNSFSTLNPVPESYVMQIDGNNTPNKLSFSTNGIDGIGDKIDTFKFNDFYYTGQKIYFTVKYKSNDDFDVKNVPILQLNSENTYNLNLTCLQNNSKIDFNVYTNSFTATDAGGFFKGYMIFDEPLENLKLIAESNTGVSVITGESNVFNIYQSKGLYDYRKINEDNDQKKNYKDLIFQEILFEKNRFFDDFLGTIVGSASSNVETLGIKVYEKISNFVSNNSDFNYSNLDSLLSQLENFQISFEKLNINFPPSLQRLVDLLSINLSLQKGAKNNFNFNFDDKGYVNSNLYGINKGEELLVTSSELTANGGQPIVAYEKFSEKYTIVNTNLISAYDVRFNNLSNKTYNLSSYDDNWGWGLVLPDNFLERSFIQFESGNFPNDTFLSLEDSFYRLVDQNYDNIKKDPLLLQNYYEFYEYIDTIEGSYLQKFIDYDNPNTNVGDLSSYNDYIKDGGFIDEIITNNLLTNTSLVTSTIN